MPMHWSVAGTAVSPPLTCSSGGFYKQMNYEWVSVVKKIPRKRWHWASLHSWHPEVIWKLMEDYFPLSSHRHPNLGTARCCNVLHESMCRMVLNEEISFWLCKKKKSLCSCTISRFSSESAVHQYKCLMCKHANTVNSLQAYLITW